MNRKEYCSILISPVIILIYGCWLRTVYQLCQYGGIRRRAPVIIGLGAVLLLWFLIWTIIYFVWGNRKATADSAVSRRNSLAISIILLLEAVSLCLCTVFYGYRIYQTSIPYNGKLAWYIEEKKNCKQVPLTENHFYETGIDGILSALEAELGVAFTQELYVSGNFNLAIDENGTITSVDTYLFSLDETGIAQSYLISYDASADEAMTVWLNGEVNVEYPDQKRLQPMRDMIQALMDSALFFQGEFPYVFHYAGYQQKSYSENWFLLSDGTLANYPSTNYGMSVTGYMMTVSANGCDIATIVSDVDSLQTIAEIEAEEQLEIAKESGQTLFTDEKGTMTFYLNGSASMNLQIVDAAAGSRWYSFSSSDGITNPDPFDGAGGVAEGIYFTDEDTGWILLSSPSSDYSRMFYTENGGTDFVQVTLPMEDAKTDLAQNSFAFVFEDFDYIDIPYEEHGALYVKVGINAAELSYVSAVFISEDQGKTWVYDHVDEMQ